jgi:hypothetical protein
MAYNVRRRDDSFDCSILHTQGSDELSQKELHAGVLYAVLTYGGELSRWNWAFFIADPSCSPIGSKGTFFYVGRSSLPYGQWSFEVVDEVDVISSSLVVALIELTDSLCDLGSYSEIVGKDSEGGILHMFEEVELPKDHGPSAQKSRDYSSKIWSGEVLTVLHDCGLLNCHDDDVKAVVKEISRLGFRAMDTYLQSQGKPSLLESKAQQRRRYVTNPVV